jgi:hypothetical protein
MIPFGRHVPSLTIVLTPLIPLTRRSAGRALAFAAAGLQMERDLVMAAARRRQQEMLAGPQ